MADSNSTAPRCPCGFWGTPQTGGLCSKCFKKKEPGRNGAECRPTATSMAGATALTAANLNTPLEQAMSSSSIQDVDTATTTVKADSGTDSSDSSNDSNGTSGDDKGTEDTDGATADSPGANNKRDISEVQDAAESELPVQKNKKRCFKCNCKLELAIREIGKCKCNYVFCQLHRLPEQHDCIYDHKEKGRKAAREKMISPKKHAGTSIKRMDSCS